MTKIERDDNTLRGAALKDLKTHAEGTNHISKYASVKHISSKVSIAFATITLYLNCVRS